MVHLTKHNAGAFMTRAHSKYQGLKQSLKEARIAEHGARVTNQLVRSVEVSGAAFMVGLLQGRTGGLAVAGVPAELLIGAALSGAALLGLAGDASHHLACFGDGALAAYAVTAGRGVGVSMRAKSMGGTPAVAAGAVTSLGAGSEGLSVEEIAALARSGT